MLDQTDLRIMAVRRHKEAIHSGHFMVSNFEADEQDDIDDDALPALRRNAASFAMEVMQNLHLYPGDEDNDG